MMPSLVRILGRGRSTWLAAFRCVGILPVETDVGRSHRPAGEEISVQAVQQKACQRPNQQLVVHSPLVLALQSFCLVVYSKDVLCLIIPLSFSKFSDFKGQLTVKSEIHDMQIFMFIIKIREEEFTDF